MSQEPKVTRFGALPLIDSELATKAYVDAGGGGTGQTFAKVVKSVDETINNSSTYQDDDEITFTPEINKVYGFFMALFIVGTSPQNIKLRFSLPAGASGERLGTGGDMGLIVRNTSTLITNLILGQNATIRTGTFPARLLMGATAGDVTLQWAQNSAGAFDLTLKAGSYIVVWEET